MSESLLTFTMKHVTVLFSMLGSVSNNPFFSNFWRALKRWIPCIILYLLFSGWVPSKVSGVAGYTVKLTNDGSNCFCIELAIPRTLISLIGMAICSLRLIFSILTSALPKYLEANDFSTPSLSSISEILASSISSHLLFLTKDCSSLPWDFLIFKVPIFPRTSFFSATTIAASLVYLIINARSSISFSLNIGASPLQLRFSPSAE